MSDKTLRYGLIGVGANVYKMHKPGLELDLNEIAGVCDVIPEIAEQVGAEWNCPHFTDYKQMIDTVKPDVVVVMTPHPLHMAQTVYALKAGCHVLVEKPMDIEVAKADAMIAAAEETGRVLAVNFQQRLRPEIIAARELIQSGALGQIQNVEIKMTWTRTAVYYSMKDWRGTWPGEGGAVLPNQAPHELDLLCHLVGQPRTVFAWCRTLVHDIQPEDTFQAILEWENGALGSLHISTAEAGIDQRFEIAGTGGILSISKGGLQFKRFDTDVAAFIRSSKEPFAAPGISEVPVELGDSEGNHAAVHRNLYDHLVNGAPLSADGKTGILGLELANAIHYASHTNQPVTLPLDRDAYHALLTDKIAGQTVAFS